MRKMGIFVLITTIVSVLVACSVPSETQNTKYTVEDKNVASEMPFMLNSLEEYQKYVSSLDHIPDMILYEDISHLGEFRFFMDNSSPLYRKYTYGLYGDDDYPLYIDVRHEPDAEMDAAENKLDRGKLTQQGDLRKLSVTQSVILDLDGFRYKYIGGRLMNVSWYENGMKIKIGGNSLLYDYPDTTDTFMGKLLNSATAPDAIKTIKAMNITEGLPRGTADANITPVS